MKRWNNKLMKREENESIDLFIEEIVKVCRKYGMSISHEDRHGSFEIENFKEEHVEWLSDANDSID